MADYFQPIEGDGPSGTWLGDLTEYFGKVALNKNLANQRLFALGVFGRNQHWAGSLTEAIDVLTTGDLTLFNAFPLDLPNANNQISGAAGVVVRARFYLRVSDAAIAIRPKIYDVTAAAALTISGDAACSATDEDLSGSNQQQTILITLPNADHVYLPKITVTGITPGSGIVAWAKAVMDVYVA